MGKTPIMATKKQLPVPDDLDEIRANARLIAAAPEMYEAGAFAVAALSALTAYEADFGGPLPDDHELGRIEDSRGSPSFRIRVGHIRRLAAAIARATGAA
jgi:hypothetical protein